MKLTELVNRPKNKLTHKVLPFDPKKAVFPCWVQEKYDGVYCMAHVYRGGCGIYSRTGEVYSSMEHIKDILTKAYRMEECVIIFEAIIPGQPQPVISGACRDTKNQHPEIIAKCFDYIPWEDFKDGFSIDSYKERYTMLNRYLDTPGIFDLHAIHTVYTRVINNKKELYKFYSEIMQTSKTIEGIVVKDPYAHWYAGERNAAMMKMKRSSSYDLKVVGMEEGKGKYVNHVGKLICEDAKGTKVKVGSGITDHYRAMWWDNPTLILGAIVEVQAMGESSKGTLREPRYKGIRYDKGEADTI